MAPRKSRGNIPDPDKIFHEDNPLKRKPEIAQVIEKTKLWKNTSDQIFEKITWTSHGSIGTIDTSLTGSAHVIEAIRSTGEKVRILLDLGMFQGKGSQKNPSLPISADEIDAMVLTHWHLDHCGRIPLLKKNEEAFVGEIHSTPITREVAFATMKDSAKISENGYDEKHEKYIKLVRDLQFAERIVRNYENKGVPRNHRNGDRMKGTGELPESLGEWKDGARIKNKIRWGSAIHEVSLDKVQRCRDMLAEYDLYDLKNGKFTGKKIAKVIKAPEKHLYTLSDVEKLNMYFQTTDYNKVREILPGVQLQFSNAGHIAGSAMALLNFDTGTSEWYSILYSWDVGRVNGEFHPYGSPVLPHSGTIHAIAHESTYGGQVHVERAIAKRILGETIKDAQKKWKKAIIIPTFAIERCASMLHTIQELRDEQFFEGDIILDSPLGLEQTLIASKAAIDENFAENLQSKKNFKFWKGEDREWLEKSKKFKVIVTGSGMANGWPILDYLKRYSNNDQFEFAFVGYQAEGTIGRSLTVDRRKSIEIDGMKLEIKAKINAISGFSAHADEHELYKLFYEGRIHAKNPDIRRKHEGTKYLVVHGEDGGSRDAFENMLERRTHELAKKGRKVKMPNAILPGLSQEIVLFESEEVRSRREADDNNEGE
jgi:metallo-beta-lactamase family protein